MGTNPYINHFTEFNEQHILNDLTVESIRMFGHDLVYLPRFIRKKDDILKEPEIVRFREAIDVEMFIKSWEGFEGQGHLIAKFGLEIRDTITLVLSKKSFLQFIYPITNKERPLEGDCIFIPLTKSVFQIKYVESDSNFYQLGRNYSWDISAELLEYSNEQFQTGRPEIDDLYKPFQHTTDPNYKLSEYDKTSQNEIIQDKSDDILDWSESNLFGDNL